MIFLLALLGLVSAGNDESKCAMDFLNGETNDYSKCEMEEEIDDLIRTSQECWTALGKCQGGGGGGGTIAPMGAVIRYGDMSFPFGLSSKYPLGAAYDEIHKRATGKFEMDEDHELTFDYASVNPKFEGKVTDDESLEAALLIAQRMGFRLILDAHKTTLSPTPEPTEPWQMTRTVKQKFGSVADGRDSGIPNDRTMDFTKVSLESSLRLHYEDNFRVYNHGGVCYWELYLDDNRIPSAPGKKHYIRGAMHSHGHQNNDHQTGSIIGVAQRIEGNAVWNKGKHKFRIQLSGNNRDCYTGWDPESKGIFLMEVKEVIQNEGGYHYKSQYGPGKGEDNMFPITDRELIFQKESATSLLRLVYMDNMRVHPSGSCRWYIKVNGKECDWYNEQGNKVTGWIAQSMYRVAGTQNDHVPQAFGGYCAGVAAGTAKVQVGVNAGNDCYTGWESSFLLEALEIPQLDPADEFVNGRWGYQRHGNNIDGRDNGYLDWRVLKFYKKADNSFLRMFYSDNLRVHGHGKWCKWEFRVDGEACTPNISGNRYIVANQNDHSPGIIVGYCKGIKAGAREFKVHVKGNSADCMTGWDRQEQNNFMMEVEEVNPNRLIIVDGSTGLL